MLWLFIKSSRSVGFTILRALARLGLVYVSEGSWLYNSTIVSGVWMDRVGGRERRGVAIAWQHSCTCVSREEISSHRSVWTTFNVGCLFSLSRFVAELWFVMFCFLRRLTREIYFYETVVNHIYDTAELLRTFGIRYIRNLKYEKRLLDRDLAHVRCLCYS